MRADPLKPDPWHATVTDLAKLSGRSVMGSHRMPQAPRQPATGKRIEDSGIAEAHLGGRLGALLD